MRQIFYQANFCAECGNALKAQPGWRPRYFCATCAQQQRQRSLSYQLGLPLVLLGGMIGWTFFGTPSTPTPANPAPPTVTALDATAQTQLPLPAPTPEPATAFCGARTKRGTPCRRLVQPGQRCAQHRGQASLIEK